MFEKEVEKYLKGADYLTEADGAWTVALKAAAKELDTVGVQSALLSQYRQILLILEKKRPEAKPEPSALEKALGELQGDDE